MNAKEACRCVQSIRACCIDAGVGVENLEGSYNVAG